MTSMVGQCGSADEGCSRLTHTGNMVITEAVERLFAKNPDHGKSEGAQPWLIADIYQGAVAIRGENVAVAGVVVSCIFS